MTQSIGATHGSARWRPAPAIFGSFAIHAGAAVALAAAPQWWPTIAGTLVANHAVLTAAGLWPRSHLLGPNLTKLPAAAIARNEIAITIDDGPDEQVTPLTLSILARYAARASFFCIGARARALPQLCRQIVNEGHTVENHTEHHSHNFSFLGLGGFRRELGAAQATIEQVTGVAPMFFRAPAGLRNPLLDPVLARLSLRLASWTRRGFDTLTRDADLVTQRLTANLSAGDILLLHDGHAARTHEGKPIVLEVLPRVLELARNRGLRPVTLRAAMQ